MSAEIKQALEKKFANAKPSHEAETKENAPQTPLHPRPDGPPASEDQRTEAERVMMEALATSSRVDQAKELQAPQGSQDLHKPNNLEQRASQLLASVRLLALALFSLSLSLFICVVGLPIQWAFGLLDRAQREQARITDTLRRPVRAQAPLLLHAERLLVNMVARVIAITESILRRPGLVRQSVETVDRKRAEFMASLNATRDELSRRVETTKRDLRHKKDELIGTYEQQKLNLTHKVSEQRNAISQEIQHVSEEIRHAYDKGCSSVQQKIAGPRPHTVQAAKRYAWDMLAAMFIIIDTMIAIALTSLAVPKFFLANVLGRPRPAIKKTQ